MEMSITRALNEIKLLDSRIRQGIENGNFIGVQIGKKPVNNYYSVEDFIKRVQSCMDSVKKLISRRNEIKSAIVHSNSITYVTIGGKQYTVAEAIERKTSIIYDRELLLQLRNQMTHSLTLIELENKKSQDRLDKQIDQMLGTDRKEKQADVDAFTKVFNESNEAKLVNPLLLQQTIEELQKSIEDWDNEIDFILSESNVRTTINVSDS